MGVPSSATITIYLCLIMAYPLTLALQRYGPTHHVIGVLGALEDKSAGDEGSVPGTREWYIGPAWNIAEFEQYFWWKRGQDVERNCELWSLLEIARAVV